MVFFAASAFFHNSSAGCDLMGDISKSACNYLTRVYLSFKRLSWKQCQQINERRKHQDGFLCKQHVVVVVVVVELELSSNLLSMNSIRNLRRTHICFGFVEHAANAACSNCHSLQLQFEAGRQQQRQPNNNYI